MAEKQRARLGAAMRARRHELDMTPGQVAEALFISGKTLERWERGETMGAIRNVDKIAAVLETTEELLLAGVDENKPTETPDLFAQPDEPDDLSAKIDQLATDLDAMRVELEASLLENHALLTQIVALLSDGAPAARKAS